MITELLKSTPGDHALIVPSSVAKIKGADFPFTVKSGEPLNTIPVGEPVPDPFDEGISTSSPCFTPSPLYRVDQPEPASLTQNGDPDERASPQPLTNRGSTCLAWPT